MGREVIGERVQAGGIEVLAAGLLLLLLVSALLP